jgi:hypothetical protein
VIKPKRKVFNWMFALITWSIWLQHNERVFHNSNMAVVALVHSIQLELWCVAKLIERSALIADV